MNLTTIVVDDFLDNPDNVRESALETDFNVFGNFPGSRSGLCDMSYHNYLKDKIESLINYKIENFQQSLRFQLCPLDVETWIHSDESEFTGIIYLTPDAPVASGTGLYRYKNDNQLFNTSQYSVVDNDPNNWELISMVGNVYNRLLIIKGNTFHRSMLAGFGTDKNSARLTQIFFFNTNRI